MPVTVNPPKTPVTEGSNGIAAATLPNVCKMPGPPAPFVPVPLPNIGKSGDSPKDYTTKVTVEGKNVAIQGATFGSMGDVASKGTGGGLISSNTHGPTKFVGPGSMDVKFEGKNVQLMSDPMLNNCGGGGSPPNAATMVGLLQVGGMAALVGDELCGICGTSHGPDSKLEESSATQGDSDSFKSAIERAIKKAEAKREQHVKALTDAAKSAFEARKAQMVAARAAAIGKAPQENLDRMQANIDALRPAKINDPPKAGLSAMLGVVHCQDGKVYAGTSSDQYSEVCEEVPGGWHVAPSTHSLFAPDRELPDLLPRMSARVANPARFAAGWLRACEENQSFREGLQPEPFYPPGQCAAQQVVLLAIDHGGRPVGLTERWFSSADPAAKVTVMVRTSPTAAPVAQAFGGKDAVPPCGSCQIVLTMLMCGKPKECKHETPGSKVCRCT